jgi:hypothetical protein
MYGLVCTRLHSYDVKVGVVASKYVETILAMPEMADWMAAARLESPTMSRTRDGVLSGRPTWGRVASAQLSCWPE